MLICIYCGSIQISIIMFDTECSVTVIRMETFLSVDVAIINISDTIYSTLCVNVFT
jgi:hypothetical protein